MVGYNLSAVGYQHLISSCNNYNYTCACSEQMTSIHLNCAVKRIIWSPMSARYFEHWYYLTAKGIFKYPIIEEQYSL